MQYLKAILAANDAAKAEEWMEMCPPEFHEKVCVAALQKR
jgi:hypothetical protein